ncbi:uncharacterized protein SPAPADRAFT_141939 [Spathaspora passalidarum NRRL Y-27907]|uniref:Uncharacterized protein n=1 Tax=Spathaspora passalidarum (strain NRRL Y-27907 / 11-Y1) TaxID=619300 RepID=G3ASV3_SPAPN|nr:uncharacterized protein SPAPADRAFT_141939 [Spathaspora passalidarum NRRL Y-27907]EGW30735.1 hypothetical protein SPAPADRAFT_141939 [Spathaspora passalidarum NRRL Y-27907]
MALKNGASLHTNSPAFPPSAGASEPNKSTKSVCSDKLIRTKGLPVALANAVTKSVLPTPGLPSNKIGLWTCMARITLMALDAVVGACKLNDLLLDACTTGIENNPAESTLSVDVTLKLVVEYSVKS